MLEVEMKFPVADFADVEQRLAHWGERPDAPHEEVDRYFNAPDRDFAQTDEALRLRRIGAANQVTYKGPKHGGLTETRTESEGSLEAGAEAADNFCRLLTHLGYRAVAVVRKKRTSYHFNRDNFALTACL